MPKKTADQSKKIPGSTITMLYIHCVFALSMSTQSEVKFLQLLEPRFFEETKLLGVVFFRRSPLSTASGDRNRPFVALRFRYHHNPSGIPAPLRAQRQKIAGNYVRLSNFYHLFYHSLQKFPTAISLLFAIK